MRKKSCALSLLAAACAAGAASSAHASLLIYEPFSSSTGTAITGTSPTTPAASVWNQAGTASTNSANVHQIGSPGLTAPSPLTSSGNMADMKLADNGEMERLNIPNAFTTIGTTSSPIYTSGSTLYYSLLLDVPSIAGMSGSGTTGAAHGNPNANNDFLAGFNNVQGSQAGRPSSWVGELTIRLGSTAGTYNLGVRSSNTPAGTTYWTGDLTPGTTHFIVVQEVLGTSNSMWLDPSPASFGAAVAPTADGTDGTGSVFTSMQSLLIGAGISANSTPSDNYLDEIRVGNTWADVTTVPEPATLGLFGLSALGLATRRRRTT